MLFHPVIKQFKKYKNTQYIATVTVKIKIQWLKKVKTWQLWQWIVTKFTNFVFICAKIFKWCKNIEIVNLFQTFQQAGLTLQFVGEHVIIELIRGVWNRHLVFHLLLLCLLLAESVKKLLAEINVLIIALCIHKNVQNLYSKTFMNIFFVFTS